MTYENVTFVEAQVKKFSEEEFIEAHIGHFWLDRDEETRKKMLADVYKRITGTGKGKGKK